jgi:hypothetical protein
MVLMSLLFISYEFDRCLGVRVVTPSDKKMMECKGCVILFALDAGLKDVLGCGFEGVHQITGLFSSSYMGSFHPVV